ncbi:2-keto-4-pentenoate hydratase [Breznakiella homolactica]|uniref:Fumarylacetoacetate hydrolase family protein n=1 Tax=Breznakiella homolactica TaxID=2798577 RepID=A0A7T8BCA7_9SPIR|nr:fumarylacetoacetate hydrolase family protein [Breznakiella homolactica]QQO10940.1 fumarylacetoacetate hydrolase family protein [Breznakiella homolactica]
MDVKKIAQMLYEAEKKPEQVSAPTAAYPGMTIEDAYAVQLENIGRKLNQDGERLIGMKVGLTSKAMQKLLGVNEPDYGHLTDRMLLLEGAPCECSKLLQPKVEGELAFCLDKPLKGPGVTLADVYNATAWVVPSIEIVDSRVKDWKITLADTVADNGSSAMLVLGSAMRPVKDVDMRLTGMTLEKNGELINSGAAAEVLGNPAAAVAWLANKLSEFGIGMEAGSIVLAGALTAAQPAVPGDSFTVSFQGMGSISLRFV